MPLQTDHLEWQNRKGQTHQVVVETSERVWSPTYYAEHFGRLLIDQPLQGARVVDVGTGSGVLGILAAKLGAQVTATDLNPAAVEAAKKNADANGVQMKCFVSDGLAAVIRSGKLHDLVLCNPPSIPGRTSPNRVLKEEWSENGPRGRSLLDAVLLDGPRVLASGGRLLTCSNGEQEWSDTERALKANWAAFRILEDAVFPMDLNVFQQHLDGWIQSGYVWKEGEQLFHNVKFVMAYC